MKLRHLKKIRGSEAKHLSGCIEQRCRPQRPHGTCRYCQGFTCQRSAEVDPQTLRRRVPFVCDDCFIKKCHGELGDAQESARLARSQRDWAQLTDPVETDRLELGRLPEQFPGPTRRSLRAFVKSGETNAVVDGISAESLNNSIIALGLTDDVYAEVRGRKTVLRRIEQASE